MLYSAVPWAWNQFKKQLVSVKPNPFDDFVAPQNQRRLHIESGDGQSGAIVGEVPAAEEEADLVGALGFAPLGKVDAGAEGFG